MVRGSAGSVEDGAADGEAADGRPDDGAVAEAFASPEARAEGGEEESSSGVTAQPVARRATVSRAAPLRPLLRWAEDGQDEVTDPS